MAPRKRRKRDLAFRPMASRRAAPVAPGASLPQGHSSGLYRPAKRPRDGSDPVQDDAWDWPDDSASVIVRRVLAQPYKLP